VNKLTLGLAVIVLLTMTVRATFGAEPVHVPATPEAAASADLIVRADRALRAYVAACATGNDEALAHIVTNDAVVEYTLEEPGTYLAVDASALTAKRSVNAGPTRTEAHISKLWIFPTNDPNVAFVHYTIGLDVGSPAQVRDFERLALLEMRGDQIFRMRHFGAMPQAALSDTRDIRGCACDRILASQRARPEDRADVPRKAGQ
jgi:hypothetical protein